MRTKKLCKSVTVVSLCVGVMIGSVLFVESLHLFVLSYRKAEIVRCCRDFAEKVGYAGGLLFYAGLSRCRV